MKRGSTVLLAEDEPNDVFLMQRSIRRMGAPVSLQVAKDGEEAIKYLTGRDEYADRHQYPLPNLILLDIKMPRRTGLDVLEWLRKEGSLTHIPVVMLTSSRVKSDIERAFELGAKAYLVKPVAFEELQQLLTAPDDFLAAHSV